jgi:hypothetical protein
MKRKGRKKGGRKEGGREGRKEVIQAIRVPA